MQQDVRTAKRLPILVAASALATSTVAHLGAGAAHGLDGCSTIYPAQAGWAIAVCTTDESPLVSMPVSLNGGAPRKTVGVQVYRASPDPNHMPQVAVLTSDGFIRLKPVDRVGSPIQFGTSFVLGPAYWDGPSSYRHNPTITRLDIDTRRLPATLELHLTGTNGALSVSWDMSLMATTEQTRVHVHQEAVAVSSITLDPVRRSEGQSNKPVQFSSMYESEAQPCGGGQFVNCNDANVVRFLRPDGLEVRRPMHDVVRPALLFKPAPPLGDHIVELLQTSATTWQGPTPDTRIIVDTPPADFAVQGYLDDQPEGDPRKGDNLGVWIHEANRTAYAVGERATIGYTLVAGDSRVPEFQGFSWFSDGEAAKSGPRGTAVSAFATSVRTNTPFQLVSGRPSDTGSPCATDVVAVNTTVRFSSSRGFIPITSGTIHRPPGVWDICFYEVEPGARGRIAGLPLQFTVTA